MIIIRYAHFQSNRIISLVVTALRVIVRYVMKNGGFSRKKKTFG